MRKPYTVTKGQQFQCDDDNKMANYMYVVGHLIFIITLEMLYVYSV